MNTLHLLVQKIMLLYLMMLLELDSSELFDSASQVTLMMKQQDFLILVSLTQTLMQVVIMSLQM
jgi:hypothetical protein